MMTSKQIDPQFFNDNMLTDADFQFDVNDILEEALDDNNVLKNLVDEFSAADFPLEKLLCSHDDTCFQNFDSSYVHNNNTDTLMQSCTANVTVKQEETYQFGMQTGTMDNISVISIPEDTYIVTDTPPQTPPGPQENFSDSPPKNVLSPILLSLNPVQTMTYIVPQVMAPSAVKSTKQTVNIKPKIEFPDDAVPVNISTPTQNPLTNGVYKVKRPASTLPVQAAPTIIPTKMIKTEKGDCVVSKRQVKDACDAALKRQERMIKNRESANLSRKRRQEHLTHLESELKKFTVENMALKMENSQLKMKISSLENELLRLRSIFSGKTVKKTACVMAVFLMLTFNIASYGTLFSQVRTNPIKSDLDDHRIGRVLLWNEENTTSDFNSSRHSLHRRSIPELPVSEFVESWDPVYNFSTCQQFINKSESIRLENDLLGWVKRVEKKQEQSESSLKMLNPKAAIPPLPKLQQLSAKLRNENKDVWAKRKSRNEILIYQTLRKDYEDFFDALHRREDSFYFISFSGDHLLLPAIAHNQTLRPRMSFVMPAMMINDSVEHAADHISMMQIDCEVMDTKLVSIKESLIPSHLRQKHNATTKAKQSPNKTAKRLDAQTIKLATLGNASA